MRKLPAFVAPGLCLLLAGCQTPLFNDGLFSSLSPNKTLTTQKASLDTSQSISATKPRIGGRGWRNATTRSAEKQAQAAATGVNNVDRLREFLAKGSDAMQKGMYDDARIQYETVLSIEPHHATAHHMLGRISDMTKQFEEAERHYLEALSANREDGYLLSDLGYSYLQQGRLAEARSYLMQAVSREPDLAIAKVNLAAVYAYAGDQKGALAWLNQVGTPQQAQETLAKINSKPAPYVFDRAAGRLAGTGSEYTFKNGQVLDPNGQPITDFAGIQEAMEKIKRDGNLKRASEQAVNDYQEGEQIRNALSEQFGGNDPRHLNQQLQDLDRPRDRTERNTRPIYIGPPGQGDRPAQGNDQGQYQQQNNQSTTSQPDWNVQGQIEQFQPGSQQEQFAAPQDPYSNLLNPAGPTGFQQQGYPNQQTPSGQSGLQQGSTIPPQFPDSRSGQMQPPNALTVPQQLPQQQYQDPSPYDPRFIPGIQNGVQPGYPQPTSPPPVNAVPRDQYGNPIQSQSPSNPAWNGQPGNVPPTQGSSAPNPGFYGQGNNQLNGGPQTGVYASGPAPLYSQSPTGPTGQPEQYQNGNGYYSSGQSASGQPAPMNQVQSANGWNNPQRQPIQQLGFDDQGPMARIDRGQRIQQYSAADRQAMQLGMAAGSGAFAPIDTAPNQTPQSDQQFQQFGNGTRQNNVVPNNGQQRPAAVAPANSGFNYDRSSQSSQPGQFSQQGQEPPDRGYPGAVPANSGRFPGQANFQAPTRQTHGQSIADQTGQDPQTAQPWLQMPTSQADVTMPAAFSSSTQPTQQQSQNWQQPNLANQSWNDGILASPTTRPEFGQPHMTNPYLRPANDQPEQQPAGQSVQTASWPSQQ